jgi:glycosyltransferase involved in cell wall biosynthesis
MRLIIVVRDIKVASGIYMSVATYLRSALASGIQSEIVTFRVPEPICREELEALGIPIHVLDDASFGSSLRQLHKALKQGDTDIVVGTTWKAYIVAKLASLGTRSRAVAWLHSIPCVIEGMARTVLFRLLSWRDPTIFASKAVKEKHRFSWHKGKEYIVYNGLEPLPDLYSRLALAEVGLPEDAFVLGYIAEFKSWKNHTTLLEAFRRLLVDRPNLHLILIGVGETFNSTVDLAHRLGLSGHIHFLRRRVDARQLLGTFDIYVHPSDGEAFGLALAEAMAAGLPVIAANAGACPELIQNEKHGLLFPPLDAGELYLSLTRLIDDQNLRTSLGGNARTRIADNFSAAAFSKSLTAAFDDTLLEDPRSSQELALTIDEH